MNVLLDKLKNDTLSGMFDVSIKAWIPPVVASILQTILTALALTPFIVFALGISMDEMMLMQQMAQDPFSNQAALNSMVTNMAFNLGGRAFGLMFIVGLVVIFFSTWAYYVGILAVRDVVNGNDANIGKILSESFNGKLIKLFLLNLLIYLIIFAFTIILALISGLFSSMVPALGILVLFAGVFVIGAFSIRLSLAMPIIVYEDESISPAISKALNAFSLQKGLKYMLMLIIAGIAMAVVGLVLALISNIFATIPYLGVIIGYLINALLSGFILTLSGALFVSMYYKYYAKSDPENNNLEDHLIYNN